MAYQTEIPTRHGLIRIYATDEQLMHETVKREWQRLVRENNLIYGKPGENERLMRNASQKARIDEFIRCETRKRNSFGDKVEVAIAWVCAAVMELFGFL